MKHMTIQTAIDAIQAEFYGLAKIVNIDAGTILDIFCIDQRTGAWYEAYSDDEWKTLTIAKIAK